MFSNIFLFKKSWIRALGAIFCVISLRAADDKNTLTDSFVKLADSLIDSDTLVFSTEVYEGPKNNLNMWTLYTTEQDKSRCRESLISDLHNMIKGPLDDSGERKKGIGKIIEQLESNDANGNRLLNNAKWRDTLTRVLDGAKNFSNSGLEFSGTASSINDPLSELEKLTTQILNNTYRAPIKVERDIIFPKSPSHQIYVDRILKEIEAEQLSKNREAEELKRKKELETAWKKAQLQLKDSNPYLPLLEDEKGSYDVQSYDVFIKDIKKINQQKFVPRPVAKQTPIQVSGKSSNFWNSIRSWFW